jgi:hypothetical protein
MTEFNLTERKLRDAYNAGFKLGESKKIKTGKLWVGKEWEEAIILSIKTIDCGIEKIFKNKYPNKLLNDEKIFIGYRIYGYSGRKKYKTKIPKRYNLFVENLLNQ